MRATTLLGQGWSFARGYRDLSRHPVGLEEARASIALALEQRESRFLANLDVLVWPYRESPTRRLLENAGIEREDVARMVGAQGLDDALLSLRDAGVYVSYEESTGKQPARRGSQVLEFQPDDFSNQRVLADFMVSSSGTRSGGTPAQSSFDYIRRRSHTQVIRAATWGVHRAHTAVWMPAFPGAGMQTILGFTGAGNAPERWFTQIPLSLPGVAAHKRLANRLLDVAGIFTGRGLPRPQVVPMISPGLVIEWAREALKTGPAILICYASSGAKLGAAAAAAGISLDGLVVSLGGEPVTEAKLEAVRACGAAAASTYAFTPEGTTALSCPQSSPEELHVWDHDFAVVSRDRDRGDGVIVPALCFTTIASNAPRMIVNVENDDYGDVYRDDAPCSCEIGRLGMRGRISGPRGMSKVVTGGTTVPGAVFERMVDEVLPRKFGGGPSDYQFVEEDTSGPTIVTLRIDPRIGPVDEGVAAAVVREVLESTDAGLLASAVWAAAIPVVRGPPVPTRGGKLLAFDRLPSPRKDLV